MRSRTAGPVAAENAFVQSRACSIRVIAAGAEVFGGFWLSPCCLQHVFQADVETAETVLRDLCLLDQREFGPLTPTFAL
jgi:hypothetical protein